MTTPLRVLVLAESLDPTSGWGTYAHHVTALLRANGIEVTVLTASRASALRLPHALASRFAWWWAEVRFRQWLRVRREAFDVIHVMVEPYARLHRAFQGIPYVITVHGSYADPAMHGSGATVFTEALWRAAQIIAVSAFTKKRLPEALQSHVTTIRNGVDIALADEPCTTPQRHGVPLIFSVGVMKPRKGFEALVSGFAIFRRAHPNAELVIAGPDPSGYRATLEQHIAQAGLTGHVRLLGQIAHQELLGWYRACSAFALTPNAHGGIEGFGLVYLEAAVFGKPSVGSRDSGASEAIRHGASGVVCDPADPQEIADALEQAMTLQPAAIRSWAEENAWSTRATAYRVALEFAASSGRRNRG